MQSLNAKLTRFQNICNSLPPNRPVPSDIRQELLELKLAIEEKIKDSSVNQASISESLSYVTNKYQELSLRGSTNHKPLLSKPIENKLQLRGIISTMNGILRERFNKPKTNLASQSFFHRKVLPAQTMLESGFYYHVSSECAELTPLSQLKYQLPTNVFEYVIEVDNGSTQYRDECKNILQSFVNSDLQNKVTVLSLFVANKMGGRYFLNKFQVEIKSLQNELKSIVVPLSKFNYGSLSERSILFKYLADGVERIPTKLVLYYNENHPQNHHHIIPIVTINSQDMYVDLLDAPGSLSRYSPNDISSHIDKLCVVNNSPTSPQQSNSVVNLKLFNQIKLLKCVSNNESSEIWKIKIGPLTIAQKVFKISSSDNKSKAVKEKSLLFKCQHNNVVELIDIPTLTHEIYMEYLPYSLYDAIQLIKLNKRKPFSCREIDILSAIEYIHTQVIAHLDIKSKNILIELDFKEELHCKLCDWGSAAELNTITTEKKGTLRWSPPEMLQYEKHITDKSDIWSFGMTLSEILTCEIPYASVHLMDVKSIITRNEPPKIKDVFLADYSIFCSLLEKCLNPLPQLRPSAMELLKLINLINL